MAPWTTRKRSLRRRLSPSQYLNLNLNITSGIGRALGRSPVLKKT
jgi:hypothetical protein